MEVLRGNFPVSCLLRVGFFLFCGRFCRYFGFLFCEEEPWAAERLVAGALGHPSEHILEKEA